MPCEHLVAPLGRISNDRSGLRHQPESVRSKLHGGAVQELQAALRDASRGKGRRPPTSLIQKDGAVIGDGGSRILREHLPGNLVRGGAAGTRGIHDADHDRSEHAPVLALVLPL